MPEGARIPERQLSQMFGISRTPLREALKVLASEGLVNLLPNRGSRVRSLSEQDICDLFDLMGGLEALAGRLELRDVAPLRHRQGAGFCKVVVFVPDADLPRVSDALFAAAKPFGVALHCNKGLAGASHEAIATQRMQR